MDDTETQITSERRRVDSVDGRLILLICERMETAKRIGELKRKEGLPVQDAERERKVLAQWMKEAGLAGLPLEEMQEICEALMSMARKAQGAGGKRDEE